MEFEWKKFNLPGYGPLKIKYIKNPEKPFIANGGPLEGIKVDKYFFEYFSKKEKNACIWHEMYHTLFSTVLKKIKNELFYCQKQANWIEEFEADKYAANNYNKKITLDYLKICKKLYQQKIVIRNPKTHPPIQERIKRIKKLK